MNDLLQIISSGLQILTSSVALLSSLYAFFKSKDERTDIYDDEERQPLGHREIMPYLKWLIICSFVVYYAATYVLISWTDVSNEMLIFTVITSAVMFVVFGYFAFIGRHSLEMRTILAPKKLWEMLFNKIPEYMEECDGPFRIRLVRIGVGVGSIEDHDVNKQVNGLISRQIEEIIKIVKEGKNGQHFITDSQNLYDIEESDDAFYHKSDTDKIHGIIAFIGNNLSEIKVNEQLGKLASKFPYASIGYLSYGSYPSRGNYPPYINLKNLRTEDYIDHLVFRYYARSQEWIKLSRSYHWFSLTMLSLVLALVFYVPIIRLINNIDAEKSKILVFAPDDTGKTDFTSLVNCLLINPQPIDAKLWVKDSLSDTVRNTQRFSYQGHASGKHDGSCLIANVIKAKMFLLYDKKQDVPFKVWSGSGELLEGHYFEENESYVVSRNRETYTFKWQPGLTEDTYDDVRIRMMYSYDGRYAIEVVYDPRDSDAIRSAARHSDTFLIPYQQILRCASLTKLKLMVVKDTIE